ncbi:MAG TPA: hypothetical protein VGG90_05350 [Candidatus Dormibacteraeota bacterium]
MLAPVAYVAMFSIFNAYDDEGYFLVTLREYLAGQPLFTQAIPIYGPVYYEVMGGLFRLLGLATTHDNGRLVTLAVWLTASALGGMAAFRLTRSLWLGAGGQIVTFYVLVALVDEPLHPSGMVAVLLTGLVLAVTYIAPRPRAAAIAIGGITAALLLVKLNVGAFAALAVAFAFAASLNLSYRRFLGPLAALAVVALPPIVMAGLWGRDWVLEFAALTMISGAAVAAAALASAPRPPPPSLAWLIAGGLGVVAVSLGVALAGGTSLQAIVNGPLLGAFRFPGVFVFPLRIDLVNVAWAALWLAAALAVSLWRLDARMPVAATGAVRIAVGFLCWATLLRLPTSVLLFALPLAWIAILPPRGPEDRLGLYPRIMLPTLAVLQSLQAYPVAGTQLALAGVALVPVGAVILSDGIAELRLAGAQSRPPRMHQGIWVAPAAMALSLAAFLYLGYVTAIGFAARTPLGIAGSDMIRLPSGQAAPLASLVAAINRRCQTFITLPGMNSLYIWTGQWSPVQLDSEVWWSALDSSQQQAVLEHLKGRQGLCVVRNQTLVGFWAEGRQLPDRPLIRFIDSQFTVTGTYGGYELLVEATQ